MEENKKKHGKLVSSPVKTKKRSELQKFAETFLADDISNIRSYVKTDIVIPAIKRIISEAVNAALYSIGGSYSENPRSSRNNVFPLRTAYSSSYRGDVREPSVIRRGDAFGLDNIVVGSKMDADRVLEGLEERIAVYGIASVADLYEMLDLDCPYTGNDYGWSSLRGAGSRLVRDGYLLVLPKAMPID